MPSEEEPLLFDLEPAPEGRKSQSRKPRRRDAGPSEPLDLPLVPDHELEDEVDELMDSVATPRVKRPPSTPAPATPQQTSLAEPEPSGEAEPQVPDRLPGPKMRIAPLTPRFVAGLLDLSVSVTVTISLVLGVLLMGIQPRVADWPALAMFLVVFSFLYTVIPLAFWGQTPGMASAGLFVRSLDGQHLNLLQTLLRWVGTLLTCLGLGLPTLLAVSGGSLGDRLSKTVTFVRRD